MSQRQIMNQDDIRRALARISREISERNRGIQDVILVGIYTGGVHLAQRLSRNFLESEGHPAPVGALDINLYRDDLQDSSRPVIRPTNMPASIHGKRVVLVDDVLYTGRTVRAAMDALNDFGRPDQVQLAILLDRGHRELPIRPDFVGQNVPTARDEAVKVKLTEVGGVDEVTIVRVDPITNPRGGRE